LYSWTYHTSDWQAWSNPYTYEYQNGVNMVWYNNYERDWNESQKSLGVCSANGTNYTLGGNMRFSSEWYGLNMRSCGFLSTYFSI